MSGLPPSSPRPSGPAAFVPSARLSGAFYAEVVRPLVRSWPHAAALLGWGSDVLGYDTARSTDHGWGPRLLVLVADAHVGAAREAVDAGLPEVFAGWPVRYGWDDVAVDHHVTVTTLRAWLVEQLGFDASRGVTHLDWVLTPQQRLLGVVAGAVYADQSGALTRVRHRLRWYPEDAWRWLIACQWRRLAQEEAFVQRTAEVGDATGSAVVAARLVRDVMRMALLLNRCYAPYGKWLGTAFSRLDIPDRLPRHLEAAVRARDAAAREGALAAALEALAARHNRLGLTAPLDPGTRPYHGRPARVLLADRFADACLASIRDPVWARLPLCGAVDQVVDSTDVLQHPETYRRLAPLYAALAAGRQHART